MVYKFPAVLVLEELGERYRTWLRVRVHAISCGHELFWGHPHSVNLSFCAQKFSNSNFGTGMRHRISGPVQIKTEMTMKGHRPPALATTANLPFDAQALLVIALSATLATDPAHSCTGLALPKPGYET